MQPLKLQRELVRVLSEHQCDRELLRPGFPSHAARQTVAKPTDDSRWAATTLLWAEKHFRRIKGCEHLHALEKTLRNTETDTTLKAA